MDIDNEGGGDEAEEKKKTPSRGPGGLVVGAVAKNLDSQQHTEDGGSTSPSQSMVTEDSAENAQVLSLLDGLEERLIVFFLDLKICSSQNLTIMVKIR